MRTSFKVNGGLAVAALFGLISFSTVGGIYIGAYSDTKIVSNGLSKAHYTAEAPCPSKAPPQSEVCAQWVAANAAQRSAQLGVEANRWSAIATLLSVLSVGFVAFALIQTQRGLREARTANEISEATARRQLRAYVVVKRFRLNNFRPGHIPRVTYEINNVGQTPAYDAHHGGRVFTGSTVKEMSGKKVFFNGRPEVMSRTTVAPNLPAPTEFQLFPTPISDEFYRQVLCGQVVLGVFGALSYRDIYDQRHLTTFKMFIRSTNIRDGEGAFYACEKGNRAN